MKKIIALFIIIIAVLAVLLIPATLQKTVSIKAPLYTIYMMLQKPADWEKWRPDLDQIMNKDSEKISIQKTTGLFSINYKGSALKVTFAGNIFKVEDGLNGKTNLYDYAVIPDKDVSRVSVAVYKGTTLFKYLLNKIHPDSLKDTHIYDLKYFLETDSLRYGCTIIKSKVPDNDIIEIKKEVLAKDQFTEAAKMFAALQKYIGSQGAKQIQPVIAQFLPKVKDSVQVNVGLFIDKQVKPSGEIIFVNMPKGGPVYTAKFSGRFNQRQKVYIGVGRYFKNHGLQSAILPFESYLDNKLPVTDTDRVNIQVNFASYF